MCQQCYQLPWPPVTNWMALGRCTNEVYDPELWWPESATDDRVKIAQGICKTCPVREKCRDYAVTYRIQHGIWGGLMPAQRDALIASRKRVS
jgi:WhiB family redox-sensing transcriptional regulator